LLLPPLPDGGISPALSFCCHDRVSRYLGSSEDGLLTTIVACIAALLFKGRTAAEFRVQPVRAVYLLFYVLLVQQLRLANTLDAAPEVSCQIRPRKFHLSRDRGALDFGSSPQLLPLESTVWHVGVGSAVAQLMICIFRKQKMSPCTPFGACDRAPTTFSCKRSLPIIRPFACPNDTVALADGRTDPTTTALHRISALATAPSHLRRAPKTFTCLCQVLATSSRTNSSR
jgi:hypothetical protein